MKKVLRYGIIMTCVYASCGWKLKRYLPKDSTSWHPATDQLTGTDVYGTEGDNTMAWAIEFAGEIFDQFLFMTNDLQNYVIHDKIIFDPGIWFTGEIKDNIRSSISPSAPGTNKVYFRENYPCDPHISLGSILTNTIHLGDSKTN